MIKACVNTFDNINIGQYTRLITLLKRYKNGFESKKSKVFTAEELNKFLNEAPNDNYLLIKVSVNESMIKLILELISKY